MAKQKKSSKAQGTRDLLRIASFILFDAAVFHEALSSSHATIQSLRRRSKPLQTFLDSEWQKILAINYEPVFRLACDILTSFPGSQETEWVLERVCDSALSAASSGVLLRHDFMGRVYHKLLLRTTGHYYATYYTSVPAATLLANIAVRSPHPSWNLQGLDEISAFRVIDPACGSGTLLSASYMALKDAYILARPQPPDLDALHKALVTDVLHGWDVLDFAAHLTLTTLSLHSNRVLVREANVYTLPAGQSGGVVRLGSLDRLVPQLQLIGHGFTQSTVKKGLGGGREQEVPVEPYDLVIMNPPFSRSAKPNVTFGYRNPMTKKRMQLALKKLGKDLGATGIGRAGLPPYFMLLADNLVKTDGRVAMVLQRSVLSGVSWELVRDLFLKKCEIEYIISNYDPGDSTRGVEGWNWSENTDLGEVLIVARRTDKPQKERSTVFVNLALKPRNEVEAILVVHQVTRNVEALTQFVTDGVWRDITIGDKTVGCFFRVPQAQLKRNWQAPCALSHPELNALVLECLDPRLPCVPMSSIVSNLGVDIAQVKRAYDKSEKQTTHHIVWGHQGVMSRMQLHPRYVGYGRPKSSTSTKMMKAHCSRLLIAERPHFSTESLLAMRSPELVLATAFWEVRPKVGLHAVAILLWLNSTYGFLQYVGMATSSMGDIFKLKKDQLERLPVVDPTKLDLTACRKFYGTVARQKFARWGAEFELASKGKGVRVQIDRFLALQLKLPKLTKDHYRLLGHDPVITKQLG
jgi:hypothetical protein